MGRGALSVGGAEVVGPVVLGGQRAVGTTLVLGGQRAMGPIYSVWRAVGRGPVVLGVQRLFWITEAL